MKLAVMIDLETLSTSHDAVILSLGAVKFDLASDWMGEELDLRLDIDSQSELGRDISESTLEWWSKQQPEIIQEAFAAEDRISISDCVAKLRKFVHSADEIWSQGSFDINILENLFQQLNESTPWEYYKIRDSRTLFGAVDGALDRSNHHSALGDAKAQAQAVRRALAKIGYRGSPV